MAVLAPFIKQSFFDQNGDPLAGGKIWTYNAGTSTPRVTFVDDTGVGANTNPVILDANGQANIWLGTGFYKFVVMNAADVVQYTVDRVSVLADGNAQIADLVVDRFSGDGVAVDFNLSSNPIVTANTFVFVSGVYQQKDTYTVVGTVLTFSSPPPLGTNNIEVSHGTSMSTGAVATDSITTAKIADGAVTTAKLALGAVTTVRLSDNAVITSKIVNSNVTTAKLADGAVTQAKRAALGQQISVSSTSVTASATPIDVTNLSVTITTTGRPVYLGCVSDGTAAAAQFISYRSGPDFASDILFVRGSTVVAKLRFDAYATGASSVGMGLSPGVLHTIDVPPAGTYTYKIQAQQITSGSYVTFQNIKLIAFEL